MKTLKYNGEWRFPVENSFVRDSAISVEARLLFIIIKGHAGPNCSLPFPSLATLARYMDRHRESVQKYLNELEANGYIERQHAKKDGKFVSTRYVLFDRSGKKPLRKLPTTEKSATKQYQYKGKASSEKEKSKETKESPSCDGASRFSEFSAEWKPITETKEQLLKRIEPPWNYPSEQEFNDFLETESLDNIAMGKRGDLYQDLCANKWHLWKNRSWTPIIDWEKYVAGLERHIEKTTTGGF